MLPRHFLGATATGPPHGPGAERARPRNARASP